MSCNRLQLTVTVLLFCVGYVCNLVTGADDGADTGAVTGEYGM